MAKERRNQGIDEVKIIDNIHPLFANIFEVYMPQPTIQEVSELEEKENPDDK